MMDTRTNSSSESGELTPSLFRNLSLLAYAVVAIGCLAIIVWSFQGVGLSPSLVAKNSHQAGKALLQFWPPDRSILFRSLKAMSATIQMAVVGTLLGGAAAFPVSFFAARNTSLLRILSTVIKTTMNIWRAIPTIIYALILVQIVGLGPQPGALAIAIGTFVMLVKLYAEALESVSAGPVEAVKASGGNTIQTFVYGMFPQVFPNFVANTLYAFELNLQSSFILGFVGAGGIGYELLNEARLFAYPAVCTLLLVTIVVVNIVDFASYRIRLAIT